MTRPIILPPTDDLIVRIADHLTPEGNDYSKCRVVFPGKRPHHFLLKELGRRIGSSFLPPQTHAIDGFAELVARRHLPADLRVATQLDAVRILFDIHRNMPERLGDGHFLALERFLPLGLRLFNELEELTLSMATLRQVREQTSVITSGQMHRIAEMAEQFSSALAERHMTTRARLYVAAAESFTGADVAGDRQLVFAGFYGLTPAEQMLMRKAASLDQCATFWVRGPGLVRRLQEMDFEVEEELVVDEMPDVELVESPDVHGQVFAVAADIQVRARSADGLDERSVIVAPRPDTLVPLLQFALHQLDEEKYNVSLGFPLERTPLAGLFHALHEAAATARHGRLTLSAYLDVLLHPYVKNYRFGQRTDVSRILIHTIEEEGAGRSGIGMVGLDDVEQNTELLLRASFRLPDDGAVTADDLRGHLHEIHDRFFRSWMHPTSVGAFASSCIGIIQVLHERTTALQHPNFREFADTFIESLQELEHSLLSDLTFSKDDHYFELLRRVLSGATVRFPGSPLHGLQVLGVLETRSLRFDNVTILDANDDVLPGRSGPEALLPQKVRSNLGMDTNRDREEIVEYYITTLLRGAKHARIMYVKGGGKERSRIVERLVWDRQRRLRSLPEGDRAQTIRYRISLASEVPDPIPKTDAVAASLRRRLYSATALDMYLRCPLQFYYGRVLSLREREEASDDIDAQDVGKFVHEVLQDVFRPSLGRVLTADSLSRKEVERMAGDAFDRQFGAADVASRALLRERTISRLGEFIDEYQRPMTTERTIEVLALESQEEATLGAARYLVRFDRVERRTERTGASVVHILDYKSGGTAASQRVRFNKLDPDDRTTWSGAIGSLQLPLYALVYAEKHGVPAEDLRPAHVLLGRQTIDPKIEVGLYDKSPVGPAEGSAMVRKVLDGLIAELHDPTVPFRPTDNLDEECPRCPFSGICGTTSKRERDW